MAQGWSTLADCGSQAPIPGPFGKQFPLRRPAVPVPLVMACTPSGDESASSIKPARDRWCTDIICLLIYLLVSAATVFIGLQAIASGDPRHLLYAKDFSGQFCGNDAAVINRSYAWFPRLDRDINDAIVAGRLSPVNPSSIARFRPYALCVEACPGAFSLTNLEPYGGAVYPHAINSTPPSEYYAVSGTRTVGSYCLPTAEPAVYGARALCAKPACTDAAVANVSGTCTATLEQEAANTSGSVLTAWEAMTPEQLSVCEVLVREVQSVTYTPAAASDATLLWERQLASHADSVYASYGAIMMSSTQIIACGLVAPLLVGVVWMAVLFLFAGLFVYVATPPLPSHLASSSLTTTRCHTSLAISFGLFIPDHRSSRPATLHHAALPPPLATSPVAPTTFDSTSQVRRPLRLACRANRIVPLSVLQGRPLQRHRVCRCAEQRHSRRAHQRDHSSYNEQRHRGHLQPGIERDYTSHLDHPRGTRGRERASSLYPRRARRNHRARHLHCRSRPPA